MKHTHKRRTRIERTHSVEWKCPFYAATTMSLLYTAHYTQYTLHSLCLYAFWMSANPICVEILLLDGRRTPLYKQNTLPQVRADALIHRYKNMKHAKAKPRTCRSPKLLEFCILLVTHSIMATRLIHSTFANFAKQHSDNGGGWARQTPTTPSTTTPAGSSQGILVMQRCPRFTSICVCIMCKMLRCVRIAVRVLIKVQIDSGVKLLIKLPLINDKALDDAHRKKLCVCVC